MSEHVEDFMYLFRGLERAHGKYVIKDKRSEGKKLLGQATTLNEPVTKELWNSHLDGIDGVGIVPITDECACSFGAIDIDVYTGLDIGQIVKSISDQGLPLVPCQSKSGGLHCFLFTHDPVPAIAMKEKLESFAALLGFSTAEIFPKQTEILVSRGDIGQWINMPYFGDTRKAIGIDGKLLEVGQFIEAANRLMLTVKEFEAFTVKLVSDISDGPPCLQYLASQSFTQGTRNDGLFNVAVYLKKANPDNWEVSLDEYNTKYFDPPLSTAEVSAISKSIQRKDYHYACDKSLMKSHCNSALCRLRQFGVGDDQKLPNLTGLTKFDTTPPIWFLNVEDKGRIELTTEELQIQSKFQRRCMEVLNIMPPTVKTPVWNKIVQKQLESVNIVEVPLDSSPTGLMFEYLERFCTSRVVARNQAEILLGKPWDNEGRHHFRIMDFMDYLERQRFKEFKVQKITSLLKERGCTHSFVNIKGKGVNLWSIEMFQGQNEGFEVQEIRGGDVF